MRSLAGLFSRSKQRDDKRSELRIPSACRLTLTWYDYRGRRRSAWARVLDMNGSGAQVRSAALIGIGTYVDLRFKDLRLTGGARVRRSDPDLLTYRLGLQFSGPLTSYNL